MKRLLGTLCAGLIAAASPPAWAGSLTLLGSGKPPGGGGGGGGTPTTLANATTGAPGTTQTYSSLGGATCPAGAVAEAAVLTNSSFVTSFKDSVDSATAWTQAAAGGPGSMDMRVFKRVVPAGGFTSATTFTVVWGNGSGTSTAMIAACLPGATSITSTTNDGNFDSTVGVTSLTAPVTGTTVSPSWQFAAVGTSWATGVPGPAAGSDASWQPLANNVNGATWGIFAYYRQAASTAGPNNLVVNAGGAASLSAVWGEAKP